MKRSLLIVAGILGVFIGFGFIFPAVALWRQNGPDTLKVFMPLILGSVLVFGALVAFAKGATGRRA